MNLRREKLMNKKTKIGEYFNMKEASEYIGCSYNTLRNFINNGLKIIVIGKTRRISKNDIDEFMQAHKVIAK